MSIEKTRNDMAMHITENHLAEFPEHISIPMPDRLAEIYDGTLDFVTSPDNIINRPLIHVNFVMSREGIFNLRDHPGGGPISQGNVADGITMAALRANADAVVVGASTLRSESGHKWTSGFVFDAFPQMKGLDDLKQEFSLWRSSLAKKYEFPPTFFLTKSGEIRADAAAIMDPTILTYVLTTKSGALRAEEILGGNAKTKVLAFGDEDLDIEAALAVLKRDFGISLLLHEGGKGAVDSFLEQGLIDQLFLTQMKSSPRGEISAGNVQYLFEGGDHQPPDLLRLMTVREDEARAACLYNFDARNTRSF